MDIRDASLRYLANRMRTAVEMTDHLKEKGFDEDEIRAEIDDLKEFNYINDREYAKAYIDYAFSKGKSLYRTKQELREKGIDFDTTDMVYEDEFADDDHMSETEKAYKQAIKIIGESEITERMLAKVSRRLFSLGYGSDVIYSVLGRVRKDTKDYEEDL